MSRRRSKLAAVPAPRAPEPVVLPPPPRAYASDALEVARQQAIEYLRSRPGGSRWILDAAAIPPRWSAKPPE